MSTTNPSGAEGRAGVESDERQASAASAGARSVDTGSGAAGGERGVTESVVAAEAAGPAKAAGRGPWRLVLDQLWARGSARFGLITVGVLLLAAALAGPLSALGGWTPEEFDKRAVDAYLGGMPRGDFGGISTRHWLGVEPITGRDLFARVLHGGQVSLLIAFTATAVVVVTGTLAGVAAGYFGGRTDAVLSRLMDLTMSFPSLIFMIAMMSVAKDVNRILLITLVIGLFTWPGIARVVRGQTLSLKHREYVEAARVGGARSWRILTREILPNVSGPVIAYTTLLIPGMIATEAALSYLGVGVRPPTPSWGQMIAESIVHYETDPTYFLIPTAFLFLAVLAFTLLGDALRDILDPRGARS